MYASSLNANGLLSKEMRDLESKYDVIKAVKDKLPDIDKINSEDIDGLINSLNDAKDFTGINVVAGDSASFDPDTKTITVPTIKGDTGPQGQAGINGKDGIDGRNGLDGKTPIIAFSYNATTGDLEYEVTGYE